MGNQRFSITPSRALYDREMPDGVFRTLATLGMYGDKNGWCFPSLSTLANIRGKSKAAMSQHVKWLRERDYLNVIQRNDPKSGAQKSNKYQIKFDYPFTPDEHTPLSSELNGGLSSELNHNAPVNVLGVSKETPPNAEPFKSKHAHKKLHKLYGHFLKYRREDDGDFKDPRLYHPALRLWRGVFEYDVTPSGNWRDKIIETVGGDANSLKIWRESMEVWAGTGGGPQNCNRVLSIFENGGVLDEKKNYERYALEQAKDGAVSMPDPLSIDAISAQVEKWQKLQQSGLLEKGVNDAGL